MTCTGVMAAHWHDIERLVRMFVPVADVDDLVQETFADYCRLTRHSDEKPIAVLPTIAKRRVAD